MIQTGIDSGKKQVEMQGAILLYGVGDSRPTHATVHDVVKIGNRPEVGVGRPITEHDLDLIHKGLSSSRAKDDGIWLDPRLIAKGSDRMIWWTPPGKRPLFFKKSDLKRGTFTGKAVCPVPAMVWMAIHGHGLYVFATKEEGRPTQSTMLYQAPFFNVWGRGLICSGNVAHPSDGKTWNPEAWEAYFFGSQFTHPNFVVKDRLVKGMHPIRFWKEMVAKPPEAFPSDRLVKLPLTAGDLAEALIVDRLNKLPKPKGEF